MEKLVNALEVVSVLLIPAVLVITLIAWIVGSQVH
jgi:hypothetical protein